MLKLSASLQKAVYTKGCVLQHLLDLLATVQCDTQHSYMFTQLQRTGNGILHTLAATLLRAHCVITSKQVTIPSTHSYRFSGFHGGCSSNDGLSGFSHHVNICWDILKESNASTLRVTESGSGECWSNWEEEQYQLYSADTQVDRSKWWTSIHMGTHNRLDVLPQEGDTFILRECLAPSFLQWIEKMFQLSD